MNNRTQTLNSANVSSIVVNCIVICVTAFNVNLQLNQFCKKETIFILFSFLLFGQTVED